MISAKFDHSELNVTNLDDSIDFYAAAFGYEVTFRENGIAKEIATMMGVENLSCDLAQMKRQDDGSVLELIHFIVQKSLPEPPTAPIYTRQGHICFAVMSIDDAIAEAQTLGGKMVGEIAEYPECRACYFQEPGGSIFEMTEYRE